jgi:hypothetical protein
LNTTFCGASTALVTTMSLRLPDLAGGARRGEVYSSTLVALLAGCGRQLG